MIKYVTLPTSLPGKWIIMMTYRLRNSIGKLKIMIRILTKRGEN